MQEQGGTRTHGYGSSDTTLAFPATELDEMLARWRRGSSLDGEAERSVLLLFFGDSVEPRSLETLAKRHDALVSSARNAERLYESLPLPEPKAFKRNVRMVDEICVPLVRQHEDTTQSDLPDGRILLSGSQPASIVAERPGAHLTLLRNVTAPLGPGTPILVHLSQDAAPIYVAALLRLVTQALTAIRTASCELLTAQRARARHFTAVVVRVFMYHRHRREPADGRSLPTDRFDRWWG